MNGEHCIKSWATTQATIALSSAEAELYALLRGTTQTLGLVAIARGVGRELQATIKTDAQATLGIVSRQGLGKLRHIDVQYIWIQEKVKNKDVSISKVPGADNPADLFTKYLASELMQKHLEKIGVEVNNNRAKTAPQLNTTTTTTSHPHWTDQDKEGGDLDRCDLRDTWHGDNTISRVHTQPRLHRFTPRRVSGAPPCKSLTPIRVTKGKYLDNNQEFEHIDTWTARVSAHAPMKRPWVGKTVFYLRTESHDDNHDDHNDHDHNHEDNNNDYDHNDQRPRQPDTRRN
jgi:hypothetical protein